jgi:nitrite reductase/ring-hydroxylating ferredoxin subunit
MAYNLRFNLALVDVCKLDDLRENEPRAFSVNGKDLVLIKLGAKVIAFDRWCTHEAGDLSLGEFEKGIVTCPEHGAKFDLNHAGRNVLGPDEEEAGSVDDIKVYPTEVAGTSVRVVI